MATPQQFDLFADTPPVAYDPRLDEARLRQKLEDARRKVRRFTIGGMRPNLSAGARELAVNMERSARAELKLRFKALQWCREQRRSRAAS
jgi:hypothetical protein